MQLCDLGHYCWEQRWEKSCWGSLLFPQHLSTCPWPWSLPELCCRWPCAHPCPSPTQTLTQRLGFLALDLLVTTDLSGKLDSWLPQVTITQPSLLSLPGHRGMRPNVRILSCLLCPTFTPSCPSPVEQPRCCQADRLGGGAALYFTSPQVWIHITLP